MQSVGFTEALKDPFSSFGSLVNAKHIKCSHASMKRDMAVKTCELIFH